MGIKRVAVASVVLCACGPKGQSAEGPGNAEEPAALCLDPATVQGEAIRPDDGEAESEPWMASGNGDLPSLEEGWDLMSLVEADDGVQYAVVVTEGCYEGACDPQLLRVEGGAVGARASLPFSDTIPEMGDLPFQISWLAARGDEVWVTYSIVGEPEPAVGSTTRNYAAVFGAADLAPRWDAMTSSYPEASALETCEEGDTIAVDADCDDDLDLVMSMSCLPGDCAPVEGADDWTPPADCPPAPTVSHTVYLRGADGVYAEPR